MKNFGLCVNYLLPLDGNGNHVTSQAQLSELLYHGFLSQGPDFSISHEDFSGSILPSLTDRDTVLLLFTCSGEKQDVRGVSVWHIEI